MSTTLIRNIAQLVQVEERTSLRRSPRRGADLQILPSLSNAWLLIDGEIIRDFGPMSECPERADHIIDANNRMVFPTWCDSHSHLVFAGSREQEFVYRIQGLSYAEIAQKGGGILNSAKRLRATPEEVLYEQAWQRLEQVKAYGTGALEIKSGYGLSYESELKILRVIRRLKENSAVAIKATFLGAHALPLAFREQRAAYLDLLIHQLLPQIADEGLADYIDVFCEKGFYSVEEAERIMVAGQKFGLKAKIHTNQFNCLGGIEAAIRQNALSVDHLEVVNAQELAALAASDTIATLLPSAPFFLNDHYPPARQMIDANLALALASDYNPGTTPSGRMAFVLSLACIKLKMLPEEAINAATINGAFAMELAASHGSIAKGKVANLFLTAPMPSLAYLPYAFGDDLVETVLLKGKITDKARD
ncbi:MAG: imidazolonepropionase [Bacteroidota bacterium]